MVNPVSNDRVLFFDFRNDEMKFLIVILAIRFLFGLLDNRMKKTVVENKLDVDVKHPAEFLLRW